MAIGFATIPSPGNIHLFIFWIRSNPYVTIFSEQPNVKVVSLAVCNCIARCRGFFSWYQWSSSLYEQIESPLVYSKAYRIALGSPSKTPVFEFLLWALHKLHTTGVSPLPSHHVREHQSQSVTIQAIASFIHIQRLETHYGQLHLVLKDAYRSDRIAQFYEDIIFFTSNSM